MKSLSISPLPPMQSSMFNFFHKNRKCFFMQNLTFLTYAKSLICIKYVFLKRIKFYLDQSPSLLSFHSRYRSGRLLFVLSMDCSFLQFRIFSWCPLMSTSGTFLPKISSGRVYCGYSNSPSEKLSVCADPSLFSTPGIKRAIASIITMAGNSPPVST